MLERARAGELLTGGDIIVTNKASLDTSPMHLSSSRRADDRPLATAMRFAKARAAGC